MWSMACSLCSFHSCFLFSSFFALFLLLLRHSDSHVLIAFHWFCCYCHYDYVATKLQPVQTRNRIIKRKSANALGKYIIDLNYFRAIGEYTYVRVYVHLTGYYQGSAGNDKCEVKLGKLEMEEKIHQQFRTACESILFLKKLKKIVKILKPLEQSILGSSVLH